MGLRNFFRKKIAEEEKSIKSNKEVFASVGILEALMIGATGLGLASGIFTLPTLLAMSIPAIVGGYTMSEVKKNIKDSKERIATLKTMEANGVDPSRNHERYNKLERLKEEKNKENAINTKHTKTAFVGIGACLLGGFVPFLAPVALPLMIGGYGTMLYGFYNVKKSTDRGREIQTKMDKLSDSINAANVNHKFAITNERVEVSEREASDELQKEKAKKYSKEQEEYVDQYLKKLEKQDSFEEIENKTK